MSPMPAGQEATTTDEPALRGDGPPDRPCFRNLDPSQS
jgi:hypothetical protein